MKSRRRGYSNKHAGMKQHQLEMGDPSRPPSSRRSMAVAGQSDWSYFTVPAKMIYRMVVLGEDGLHCVVQRRLHGYAPEMLTKAQRNFRRPLIL